MANFVFLDTMAWIDISRGKILEKKVLNWCRKNNLQIITHAYLLFETISAKNVKSQNNIWGFLSKYSYVNLTSPKLFYTEFIEIFEKLKINTENFLLPYTTKFEGKNAAKLLNSFLATNSSFNDDKRIFTEQGNFAKLTTHFGIEGGQNKLKLFDLVNSISKAHNIKFDWSFYQKNSNNFLCKRLRDGGFDPNISAHLKKLSNQSFIGNILETIILACSRVNVSISDIAEIRVDEFAELDFYWHQLSQAFYYRQYPFYFWDEWVEELKFKPIANFLGYNISRSVRKNILISNAKIKQSDPIDYLNLAYLPYCKYYVTDGQIANAVNQSFPNYSSIVFSYNDWKEIL